MHQLQLNANLYVVGSKNMSEAEQAELMANPPQVTVVINGQTIKHVKLKAYSTGTIGFNINGKVLAQAAAQAAA